jgi:outer membrane protein OmpA-like peptidoglycan-associated protein/opacity protein-like surface antigen
MQGEDEMTEVRNYLSSLRMRGSILLILLLVTSAMQAQKRQGDVLGSMSVNSYKYHGEFSDDLFGYGGTVSLSYSAMDRLWVEARTSLGQYGWRINQARITANPDYFGQGAKIGDVYPGTLTKIEERNESRVTTVDLMVGYVLVDNIPAVPYITAGVGLVDFAPSNGSEHSPLPNNIAGEYSTTVASIPLGGGIIFPLSQRVGLSLRGEYRLVFSSNLDDVDLNGMRDDLSSFSIGLTYRFNEPRRHRPHRRDEPQMCQRCKCVIDEGCCCELAPRGRRPGGERREEPPMRGPQGAAPAESTPESAPEQPAEKPAEQPAENPSPKSATPEGAQPAAADEPEMPATPRKVAFSKSINFVVNTDQLDLDDVQTEKNLQELWNYMKQACDELQVIIEGHASSDGPPERNQELSELRAKRISQWLVDNGISASKIRSAVGRGSTSPKVMEPTGDMAKKMTKEQLEAIRSKNRRIEVVVVRDCN